MKTALPVLILFLLLSACENETGWEFEAGSWIDLTYSFDDQTIYWPTADGFRLDTVSEGMTEGGYYYSAYAFCSAEHGGTHLDAPIHFAAGRQTADEIPLDNLIGQAVVIDVSENALKDRDYRITVGDIEAWEGEHGPIPNGAILLFKTGYGQFWPDREQYLGTAATGPEAVADLHFPGIDPATATWLVNNRQVKAVGLDTPSLDYGQSALFETHQILFDKNIPGFENVAQLDQLPPTGALVIALPMKIGKGSGGPLRIVAFRPE